MGGLTIGCVTGDEDEIERDRAREITRDLRDSERRSEKARERERTREDERERERGRYILNFLCCCCYCAFCVCILSIFFLGKTTAVERRPGVLQDQPGAGR